MPPHLHLTFPFQHDLPHTCFSAWGLQPFCGPVTAERGWGQALSRGNPGSSQELPKLPPERSLPSLAGWSETSAAPWRGHGVRSRQVGEEGALVWKQNLLWKSALLKAWPLAYSFTAIWVFWAVFDNKRDPLNGIAFQHALCSCITQNGWYQAAYNPNSSASIKKINYNSDEGNKVRFK